MKSKPLFWIVKREFDGAFLCRDNHWRICVAGIQDFATFKRDINAIKFGLKFKDGTAFALYENDYLDRDGKITRNADHFANVSSIVHKKRAAL